MRNSMTEAAVGPGTSATLPCSFSPRGEVSFRDREFRPGQNALDRLSGRVVYPASGLANLGMLDDASAPKEFLSSITASGAVTIRAR